MLCYFLDNKSLAPVPAKEDRFDIPEVPMEEDWWFMVFGIERGLMIHSSRDKPWNWVGMILVFQFWHRCIIISYLSKIWNFYYYMIVYL